MEIIKNHNAENYRHQDISIMEGRYLVKLSPSMVADIAGHLEETFHRQNVTESRPLVLFR
jgi:hypothetical protein